MQLHEAQQIATPAATVAVKQILLGMDVKGGMALGMQRAETDKLGAGTDLAGRPMVLPQVVQQRKPAFEHVYVVGHNACIARRHHDGSPGCGQQIADSTADNAGNRVRTRICACFQGAGLSFGNVGTRPHGFFQLPTAVLLR